MAKSKPEQDEKGRFLPGNNGGNGRPKGSRNKLGEQFLADLQSDWALHGQEVIVAVRKNKPVEYLKVVASILPKDLILNVRLYDNMSDDELNRSIKRLLIDGEFAEDIEGSLIGPPDGSTETQEPHEVTEISPVSEAS